MQGARSEHRGFSAAAAILMSAIVAGAGVLTACASSTATGSGARSAAVTTSTAAVATTAGTASVTAGGVAPQADSRVGLKPGLFDAGEAAWNVRRVSSAPPAEPFVGKWNTDLAFTGSYVIQGNYGGFQIWDVANPSRPQLITTYVCPGAQNDVSVYEHLLFVSVEGPEGRIDCGAEAPAEAISPQRLRGVRIFDISDLRSPRLIANVQTCRGSHTHTLVVDPRDRDNIYIYVAAVAPPRAAEELAGCSGASPAEDPNSVLSRIDVIRVPLAHPEQAAIVSRPRILEGLVFPPRRASASPEDVAEIEQAKASGAFVVNVPLSGGEMVFPSEEADHALAQMVKQRGGSGAPTGADSAALRQALPIMVAQMLGTDDVTTICHDITVYPGFASAAGACIGYGVLLDIADATQPRRTAAVADSNFIAWHSATFSNDGSKVLFTDEWGGGTSPKCRAADPREWGANAIYTLTSGEPRLRSYYKMPAPQTAQENCVAHNGSLIPVPGRDVMVQGWYQGGVSVFDWTDPDKPFEIGFFDRGPVSGDRMIMAGSWSAYWYNGLIVSSEMARGLDILELTPSEFLSQNEIDAARAATLDQLNVQGQPRYTWPASFAVARAYVDQLERSRGLDVQQLSAARADLARAEAASAGERRRVLNALGARLESLSAASPDTTKVRALAAVARDLVGP